MHVNGTGKPKEEWKANAVFTVSSLSRLRACVSTDCWKRVLVLASRFKKGIKQAQCFIHCFSFSIYRYDWDLSPMS